MGPQHAFVVRNQPLARKGRLAPTQVVVFILWPGASWKSSEAACRSWHIRSVLRRATHAVFACSLLATALQQVVPPVLRTQYSVGFKQHQCEVGRANARQMLWIE